MSELTGKVMEIRIITPGWGSSGYYSAGVLEQAAAEGVFPAKTQMHIDHQTPTQDMERPAGSLTTWAAVLTEDATWDSARNGLYAQARVFTPYRELLAEMADEGLAVSISAAAIAKPGEAEGRRGTIIEQLIPGPLNRVDFVTIAGRGGAVEQVLEHATETTSRDIENQLRTLLRASYGGQETYVWLEDRDETQNLAWYEIETAEGGTIWQTGYTVAPTGEVTLSGETIQVRRRVVYDPITAPQETQKPPTPAPAGETTATTPKEEHVANIEIEETEFARLNESASRAAELETENAQLREQAAKARTDAITSAVNEAFSTVEAPRVQAAVLAEALAGEQSLEDITAQAREAAAEIRSAAGEGKPTGLGHTTREAVTRSDADIANAL
ncbi:hypothetical protein C6401_15235 [Arthrobacter woluwensis]|nr:hypothetical protein C6401_15235 [Arthrobacter woluwensis]